MQLNKYLQDYLGTLMLLFIIAFEWLYWRETCCVTPLSGARGPSGSYRRIVVF